MSDLARKYRRNITESHVPRLMFYYVNCEKVSDLDIIKKGLKKVNIEISLLLSDSLNAPNILS